MEGSILVIDDEPGVVESLSAILKDAGFEVETLLEGKKAVARLKERPFDVILLDLQMPDIDGLSVLKQLKKAKMKSIIIMMTAYGSTDIAIQAIQHGAYDYVSKPFNADEIVLTIKKAQERERLKRENEELRQQVTKRYSFNNIIAKSEAMLDIFNTVKKIADYKTTVMIYGESGTGKELVAQAIHYNSGRRNKRFVAINCGAIPENLLESELFGHKKGAFTDATRDKKGLFEEAEGGTILLDEVGDLPLHLQVKLLRVIQEGEMRPVGDERVVPIDIRIIAATLRDLEQEIIDGRFRDDLYYRLNVVAVRIPPLRERREDIPVIVEHFLKKNQEKLGLSVTGLSKEAMTAVLEHDWPGNVRELENCIERAMILTDENEITLESLPNALRKSTVSDNPYALIPPDELSIKVHTRAVEKNLISRALEATGGNRTHAAKLLEISHRTLLYKLKDYKIAGNDKNTTGKLGSETNPLHFE